jgi:TolB-like protein/DNA-binding winged helix-turn-helix (wHTH) protein/Tfp pilus assembly protein PilF
MRYRFGDCEIDTECFELRRAGSTVELEPQVFELLVYLLAHRERVVGRRELHERVWRGRIVTDAALNSRIKAARAGIGDDGKSQHAIRTLHRTGYRFVGEVMEVAPETAKPPVVAVSAEPGPVSGPQVVAGRRKQWWRERRWSVPAALLVLAGVAGFWRQHSGGLDAPVESVAVLPFKDQSPHSDHAYLASGTSVEILARLRDVDQLAVVGGDWMDRLVAQAAGDPQAIGQQLSVNYLLEGEVRAENSRMRIGARLTRVADRHVVWSQQYERDEGGLFDVQDDIASHVAGALSVTLNVGLQAARNGGTRNFQAYEHYLRGRALRNSVSPLQGVAELEQAVALDPSYARAWSELAVAYGTVARMARTPEAMAAPVGRMDEASAKATALAPEMWFTHAARVWYYVSRNDWLHADQAHREALSLDHGRDPELYENLYNFEHQIGSITTGRRLLEQLARLDPRMQDLLVGLLINALQRRDFAAARADYEGMSRTPPRNPVASHRLAFWTAMAEGKLDQARAMATQLLTMDDTQFASYVAVLEDRQAVLAQVRHVEAMTSPGRLALVTAALMAGQYGDPELAVRFLRRGYLGPGWAAQFYIWFPQLRDARRTPAFKDFVRDLGFVAMWRASGDWGDFCRPLGDEDFECS